MNSFVRLFARVYVHAWYRISVFGEPFPVHGPLLVCSNHTNGLMDVGLLFDRAPRPLRFLAKYSIFSMPVVGSLARAAHAIPVYRKKDGVPMERNAAAFEAVFDALRSGEALCVFPEGESRTSYRLRPPLKTGIARMGLGALEGRPDLEVRVLPVGVHTEDRDRFRSRLELHVGAPLSIAHRAEAFAADPRAAVPALMEELETALRAVAPDLREDADLPVLRLARRVWRSEDGAHVPRLAALTARLAEVRAQDPAGADVRASAAAALLQRLGREPGSRLGLLAGPLVLAAALVWGLPTLAGRAIARRAAPADKFVTVTALLVPLLGTLAVASIAGALALEGKLLPAMLILPGAWLLLAVGVRALDAWWGALASRPGGAASEARDVLAPLEDCPIH